jgi:hypothetical protein
MSDFEISIYWMVEDDASVIEELASLEMKRPAAPGFLRVPPACSETEYSAAQRATEDLAHG